MKTQTKPVAQPPQEVKPLPKGYLWRLGVILVLLIGGALCTLFYNALLGGLMSLAGFAFGKFSGLNEMVDKKP